MTAPFDDKPALLRLLNQAMVEGVPYNTALGLTVIDAAPAVATTMLPYRAELVGNPETGVLHGGAITGMIDATCGLAIFLRLPQPTRIATLDLRIDYLKPAAAGRDVRARAECYKLTRRVAFVRAVAYHDDPADPIASSAGTFMVFDEGSSPIAEAMK